MTATTAIALWRGFEPVPAHAHRRLRRGNFVAFRSVSPGDLSREEEFHARSHLPYRFDRLYLIGLIVVILAILSFFGLR